MKTLHFDYDMRLLYAEEVKKCYFTIKCIPPNTARQRLEKMEIEMEPSVHYERGEDSFGNQLLYGRVDVSHRTFSFHIAGEATTGLAAHEISENGSMTGLYRYPYGLTVPGDGLKAYHAGLESDLNLTAECSDQQKGIILMNRLYQDFSYEKNVTGVTTSAEDAWRGGSGVCQDYAHIMIALCRLSGIPARYVTGMLIGEGYSHAWVEICSGGKWYGLDPTNNLIVAEDHIKLGTGRDASDCPINRGLLTGGGAQTQTVYVSVKEGGIPVVPCGGAE